MISVVMPTYNMSRYLKESIDSVLAQSYKDFEIIVVDDGSTDDTKELVLSYKDKVRYVYQENREKAAARNNGIRHSYGDYVAFLDSDDLWGKRHLEICVNALRNSLDAEVAFSGSYIIDDNKNVISKIKPKNFNGYVFKKIISKVSSGGCNASSCVIKKIIFDKIGYFNEDLFTSEDWEMWARASVFSKFVSTNCCTVMLRYHKGQSSLRIDDMTKSMTAAVDIIYKNEKILPKIKKMKRHSYSSLYALIAIGYYSSGSMNNVYKYIKKAVISYPFSIFTNKYLVYTFLRALLGAKLSNYIRGIKRSFNVKMCAPFK